MLTQHYQLSAGMLDASLESRSDLDVYYKGARAVLNMLNLPQGGVRTRKGFAFIKALPQAIQGVQVGTFTYSVESTYLLVFMEKLLLIFHERQLVAQLATPYKGHEKLTWTQSLDTMILTHPDHAPMRLLRHGEHSVWSLEPLQLHNIPQEVFPGGGGPEPVWSSRRGWPRSVYLLEGRLYFGGSQARPQTIWGSSSNNYFDFHHTPSNPLDDDAIEVTLDSDRVSAVEHLCAMGDFFAFTTGGVYVNSTSPRTPSNFYFQRHADTAAAPAKVLSWKGRILFLQKRYGGEDQTLFELVYNNDRQAYEALDLAPFSSTLLRYPHRIDAQSGKQWNVADHLFVVNEEGTIAALNISQRLGYQGWTFLNTQGVFRDLAVVGNDVYALVQRGGHFFLEVMDVNAALDASLVQIAPSPQTHFGSLDHLEGFTVALRGDGVNLGTTVVRQGQVTTPHPVTMLEAGLPFRWRLETMPVSDMLEGGHFTGERYTITQVTMRLQETTGLTLNGYPLNFDTVESSLSAQAPPPFSGFKTITLSGWFRKNQKGASLRMEGHAPDQACVTSLFATLAQ